MAECIMEQRIIRLEDCIKIQAETYSLNNQHTETLSKNMTTRMDRLDLKVDNLDNKVDLKVDSLENKVELYASQVNNMQVDVAVIKSALPGYEKKMLTIEDKVDKGFNRLEDIIIKNMRQEVSDVKNNGTLGKILAFLKFLWRDNGKYILGVLALIAIYLYGEKIIELIKWCAGGK